MEISVLNADSINVSPIDRNQSFINLITQQEFLYSFHCDNKLNKLTNKHGQRSDRLVNDVENCDDSDGK